MQQPTKPVHDTESGFILVVVLAVTLLLALVAAAFSHAVRGHLKTVASLAASARAEALADAGVALALADLAEARRDPSQPRRFALDGTPAACRLDGAGSVSVAITDEAGKVNLNTPNERLIRGFFTGLSASAEEAEVIIDRVLDFRDGDSQPRPRGAEAPEYLAAHGRPTGTPKNAPFDAVEELDQVLGLPQPLLARAKRWATVYTTLSGVDPEVAAPELSALLTAGAEGQMVTTAARDAFESVSAPAALPPGLAARSEQTSFTIRTVGRTGEGGRFVREAVVELPIVGTSDYVIRRWRQSGTPDPADATPFTEHALPPC